MIYKKTICSVLLLISLSLLPCLYAKPENETVMQTINLQQKEGFWYNTTRDAHIIFSKLNKSRQQLCGFSVTLTFKTPLKRAAIFDVYWRTKSMGFSESNKAFFIIPKNKSLIAQSHVVPLCKLQNYSGNINRARSQENIEGLRVDFPANRDIAVNIRNFHLLDAQNVKQQFKESPQRFLEPYEFIHPHAFTSLDIILPKISFILADGWQRVKQDSVFFVFWFLTILLLFVFIAWRIARH